MIGIMSAALLAGVKTVTSGNQAFTSSGTFTVPDYNSLSIDLNGARGSDGEESQGCPGGSGGTGGRCLRTYTPGQRPTSRIDGLDQHRWGNVVFNYGTNPTANRGGDGGPGVLNPGSGSPYCETPFDGAHGTASGGTTNTTGGGTYQFTGVANLAWS